MTLIHRYTLVCDETRQEDNGKLLIIGLYTPGLVLPQFPTQLAKLTFFNCFQVTEPGTWELDFHLSHVDTGAMVGPKGHVKIRVGSVESAEQLSYVPLPIQNIQLQMPGVYAFLLSGSNFEGAAVRFPVSQRQATRVH